MRRTIDLGKWAGLWISCIVGVTVAVVGVAAPGVGAEPTSQLSDGDRVTLIGGTLIERAQQYGYWETLLSCRYPDRRITFRNLGWSADDVEAESWSGFDTPVEGFARRTKRVLETDPTVLVVALGMAESFEGPEGVSHYVEGLNRVIDAAAGDARVVLMSPNHHEDLGRPLPDPHEHNRNLALYRDAMREVAAGRGLVWFDLFDATSLVDDGDEPLTDNGIHLTEYGYWRTAAMIDASFGPSPARWSVEVDASSGSAKADGTKVSDISAVQKGVSFVARDDVLPAPLSPVAGGTIRSLPGYGRMLSVKGLAAGTYELRIDGVDVARARADEWARGVRLTAGPEFEQVEDMRRAVIEKNLLYFRYWRPENFTYLFGHRRYEQGQNAPEVAEFLPLVAAKEESIGRLKVPQSHNYELQAASDSAGNKQP